MSELVDGVIDFIQHHEFRHPAHGLDLAGTEHWRGEPSVRGFTL
jgi:hypothetical protein